jgi:hypothetical protein
MGTSTFSGPLQAGTVRQGPYENVSPVELTAIAPISVTAVTNTDAVIYIPAYSTVTVMQVFTGTAFTGTTANITVGSAAAGAQYVAASDVKANGTVALSFVGGGLGNYATAGSGLMNTPVDTTATAANNGIPTSALYYRIAQGASPTAVGAATIVVKYTQNAV